MSLRVDIHEAIDEVVIDDRAMAARVVAALEFTPARGHRTKRRWTSSLRGIGSLVAVLMVVAVIAGVLAGSRVWQDWNSFSAHQPQPSPKLDLALIAQLEARPLGLHQIPASSECPTGPYSSYSGYGDGPVSLIGGMHKQTQWGDYYNGLAYTDARLSGPVIGRGLDLKTGRPVIFIADYAYGPAAGTDTLQGKLVQQRGEVLLDTDHPPQTITDNYKLRVWGVRVGIQAGASGCTGFQFDGAGFTETFVVSGGWAGVDLFWPASDNG